MYEDDDDDDDEEVDGSAAQSGGAQGGAAPAGEPIDPMVALKEAFTSGQAALKLFFFEDKPDEKFEVDNSFSILA